MQSNNSNFFLIDSYRNKELYNFNESGFGGGCNFYFSTKPVLLVKIEAIVRVWRYSFKVKLVRITYFNFLEL